MAILLSFPAEAQLTKNHGPELEKTIAKTAYLRIDLPCVYGKQGLIASWVEPVVSVSPTGVMAQAEEGWSGSSWTGTKRSLSWAFGPNDALKYEELEIDKDGSVVLHFEGLGPKQQKKNRGAAIRIVQAKTAADFKAAFDFAFSSVPLQDEHPEWPEDVRRAVGEHRVIEGMTQDQAACVVGKPVDIEAGEENGNKVETWHIRQPEWMSKKEKSSFANKLKFTNGKLVGISSETPSKGNRQASFSAPLTTGRGADPRAC
jgi:hypothetical protein